MRRKALLLAALVAVATASVIGGLVTTACRGGSAPALPATPPPTQVLPTPFPTATPVVVPTPQQVTPVPAADAGRPDCPQGWNAYNDPDDHFSFCYPPGVEIITSGTTRPDVHGNPVNMRTQTPSPDYPSTESINVSENGFFIAMGWALDPTYSRIKLGWERKARGRPDLPLTEYLCSLSKPVMFPETSAPVELEIAGRTGVGCSTTGSDDPSEPPMKILDLVIPVRFDGDPQGGYVNLMVRYIGPDLAAAEAAGSAILDTLVIPEE